MKHQVSIMGIVLAVAIIISLGSAWMQAGATDRSPGRAGFVCGDVNCNGYVDYGDPLYLARYIFEDGPPPCIMRAADVNCDGIVDVADIVYLDNYVYILDSPKPCAYCVEGGLDSAEDIP